MFGYYLVGDHALRVALVGTVTGVPCPPFAPRATLGEAVDARLILDTATAAAWPSVGGDPLARGAVQRALVLLPARRTFVSTNLLYCDC
eukprot:SAG11_NODE_25937_length_352_cov_0.501976_1_plen_88_part_01